ncbi:MAG: hypothetical protein U1A77_02380 [Pirellulales bacterium]
MPPTPAPSEPTPPAATRLDPSCGVVWAGLVIPASLNPLGPGHPDESLRPRLAALSPQNITRQVESDGRRVIDLDHLRCCLSGVWLLHNFLDESHSLSQDIHTASGSYWHGIMHRREPDFGNSKYWFRQAGDHPAYSEVGRAARAIAAAARDSLPAPALALADDDSWDPFRFVNLCSSTYGRGGVLESFCREVAWAEWQVLFDYCHRRAFGLA